jgi:hypothetical protein
MLHPGLLKQATSLSQPDSSNRLRVVSRRRAVCLITGTEIAFDENVEYDRIFGRGILPPRKTGHRLARFRQVNLDVMAHHDALGFPDERIVLLTLLRPDQNACVLQVPPSAKARTHDRAHSRERSSSAVTE